LCRRPTKSEMKQSHRTGCHLLVYTSFFVRPTRSDGSTPPTANDRNRKTQEKLAHSCNAWITFFVLLNLDKVLDCISVVTLTPKASNSHSMIAAGTESVFYSDKLLWILTHKMALR
jgi:hypothetical protein